MDHGMYPPRDRLARLVSSLLGDSCIRLRFSSDVCRVIIIIDVLDECEDVSGHGVGRHTEKHGPVGTWSENLKALGYRVRHCGIGGEL